MDVVGLNVADTLLALFVGVRNGNDNVAYVMSSALGSAHVVTCMTTPKVPPPPPCRAKKRSGFWHSLAMRRSPLGTTTSYSSCTHVFRWRGREQENQTYYTVDCQSEYVWKRARRRNMSDIWLRQVSGQTCDHHPRGKDKLAWSMRNQVTNEPADNPLRHWLSHQSLQVWLG